MRCFYHQQDEAVGICKNCLRGVCADYGVDLDDGLACRGRCETKVQARNDLTRADLTRARPRAAGAMAW